jgi:hypothetical protein
MSSFWISYLWSWIPNTYFWELSNYFLGWKYLNSLAVGSTFLLYRYLFKNQIFFYLWFKKGRKKNIFLSFFCSCLIRDSGWKKIRIRDKHPRSGSNYRYSITDRRRRTRGRRTCCRGGRRSSPAGSSNCSRPRPGSSRHTRARSFFSSTSWTK